MNWKLLILGTVVFYAVVMILGMGVTGPLIHEGVLDEPYRATESFWRPELTQDPPDLGALMPRWIVVGLICTFIGVWIYSWLRHCLKGPGWQRGLKFGLLLTLIQCCYAFGMSGIFNLPMVIWVWWCVDHVILNCIGGAVLGWFATLSFIGD